MSAEVSIARAKAGFAALVARAEAGEQIVVTRNGRPVACLGPLPAKKPIVFGDLHAPNVFIDRGVQFEGRCTMAPIVEGGA